jgi:brefeldin A-inhibited guanine nucleotide-exchange protein
MHAFVDSLDFTDLSFVDALRNFLQHFRLPGESQKIDRYMLKFAERFYSHNKVLEANVFNNPDTAYVLAYSVIMLNTDLHNPQVKKRMAKEDFVRNNRGINDNKDLPPEYLHGIYDEIAGNEIKLKDDPLASAANRALNTASAVSVSRKARREAFNSALEEISAKVEFYFDKKRKKASPWINALHVDHVRNMFEHVWMAILAALSNVLQQSNDTNDVTLALEAFRHCIIVSCTFDLDLERNAFIKTLSNFTLLNGTSEMKEKNFSATKILLEVGASQGNFLRKSWLDVLKCVSQLERFHVVGAQKGDIQSVVQQETTSQYVIVATDRIFSGSAKLSGTAIVDFVEALCAVSWEEIPRMYSLTKLVEISYYNMSRIRVEWVNLWSILGQHFVRVGCHGSEQVAFFAMDSLRQLSMKFLEKEELSNFKFQREFLRPFEQVAGNHPSGQVRELVVQCLMQMIQARSNVLRSGWKAILAVFSEIAIHETQETLFVSSFEIMKTVIGKHLTEVRDNGYFSDVMATLIAYCSAKLSQKVSLQSVELIQKSVRALVDGDRVDEGDWFSALHGMFRVSVNCELEVRTRALQYLFTALKENGNKFSAGFWHRIADEILFQLFAPVVSPSADRGEELNIWLSTTLIQALRHFIDLYGVYYDHLSHKLKEVLQLLKSCILQENETLARLGASCLQQLMENNCKVLSDAEWSLVCATWAELFEATTATALLDPVTVEPSEKDHTVLFQSIIVSCVLQLILIKTVLEATSVSAVYSCLQSQHLLAIIEALEKSYLFARDFNSNLDLRTKLWRMGFTRQLPNLLRQETNSVTCLLHILFQMYGDTSLDRISSLSQIETKLIPLAVKILENYRDMDAESRKRNASA